MVISVMERFDICFGRVGEVWRVSGGPDISCFAKGEEERWL